MGSDNVLFLREMWRSVEKLCWLLREKWYLGEKMSAFGEKMGLWGESILGRNVDGACFWAEVDKGEVLRTENPVGTGLG